MSNRLKKKKIYSRMLSEKMAQGFTNSGDGKWIQEKEPYRTHIMALKAEHKRRNKGGKGHVRPHILTRAG